MVAESPNRWANPQVAIDAGATLLFKNSDPGVPHNVIAKDRGPDGGPLFRSRTFSSGPEDRPVAGTEYVPAGTYGFLCTIHPSTMADGELTVRAFGDGPVPRPRVTVSIASRRLAQVVRSGQLTVGARAGEPTPVDEAGLVARRGKRLIAKRRRIDLRPGQRRMVGMKLTRRGRKLLRSSLRRGNRARVTVIARVGFDRTSRATRRLR